MSRFAQALLAGAAGVLALALYSQNPAPPAPVQAPAAVAFQVLFGITDTQPARWDGSLRVSVGEVSNIEGVRFASGDQADKNSWKATTRYEPAGYRETLQRIAHGPMFPNGVTVTLTGASPDTQADIHTAQGDFSFHIPAFGEVQEYLDGRVQVTRVPATTQLTHSPTDEDFPAAARTPGGLLVAYISHTGDTRWTSWAGISQPPATFDALARPTGGDQVMLTRYDQAARIWGRAESVSDARLDCLGAAVALDGKGRAWVIWSAFRDGNFDLYARYREAGKWSAEMRVTTDSATDIYPVAATDSAGRVWIAWQGFRQNSLDILAAVQQGNTFSHEQRVSTSARSDWSPAIAAAPNGDVAIAWDTYDKGNYDVYARRLRYQGRIVVDRPIAVAASANFEARPSIAFDRLSRLWVAYETGPRLWGKDFGTYDTSGSPLYGQQNVAVKCLRGDDAFVTAADPGALLALAAQRQARRSKLENDLPDPSLARNRRPHAVIAPPAGVRNSIPRLAVAPEGTVCLAYRVEDPGRSTAGPIWTERVLSFDGDRWRGPVAVPHSDAGLDNHPALAATPDGHLWMIAATDHRQAATPGRRDLVKGDLYAAELDFDAKMQPVRLQPAPAAQPESAPATEAAQVKEMRDYRLRAGDANLRVLRGEFHRHTAVSLDGGDDGSLEDAYRYLIDAASMDWAGCCDHDNGTNEFSWWLEQKMTDAYSLAPAFVTMFSYERSVLSPEGHRNVIFAQRGIRPLPRLPKVANNAPFAPAPDTNMLYQYLRRFNGVTAAHQTTANGGTDWRNNDPAVETSVEIFEGLRQSTERPDGPKASNASDHAGGYYPAGYVANALEKGYRLGFESSSDHYSTHESYTMLWVAEPTRRAVLEAFQKRRLYAASDNILADVRSGEHLMGEEFKVRQAPEIKVKLIGSAPFAEVHIIKDNKYVYQVRPGSKTVDFTWRDNQAERGKASFYYVRGQQEDGGIVWASPMWITYE